MVKTRSFYVSPLLLAFYVNGVVADVSVDSGSLLNQQQRLQPNNRPTQNESESAIPELKLDDVKAADKINVKRIQFQNAENISSDAQLQAWVSSAIGKQLTFAQLQQVAEQVT